jgi:methyl-accepting chemotaxis protein
MTVAQRLYLLIFSAVVGLASLASLGVVQISKVYTAANTGNTDTVPGLLALDAAFEPMALLRARIWQHVASSDHAKKDAVAKKLDEAHAQAVAALDSYEKEQISDDKDRALLQADRSALAQYDALREKVIALSNADKPDEATDLLLANTAVTNAISIALNKHRQYNADLGTKSAEDAAATLKNSNMLAIGISLLVIVGIAGMGLMLARKIVNALNEAVTIAQTVAAGDLTKHIEVTSKDETGKLLQALKDMRDSLVRIVGEVRTGTDTIATASGQIASGNLDLSSRTEQQASALEETASSMEQLTGTVKQNADNARQANGLAVTASEVAVKGGAVVSQVIDTMSSINESARKIVDIIGVIDGIAFQTNILALNAAVEAARAGEQGRGFAVVASEVRSLAQRSAAAAKEIKTLIDDSVEKVDTGSKLVEQAGATMDEVVVSVKRVTDIVGEISSASQEQSAGIDQVHRAITQMDDVTQQNAALVEEAAAASRSMQDQAANLAQVVSVFKLVENNQAVPHTAPPVRQPLNITPQPERLAKPKAAGKKPAAPVPAISTPKSVPKSQPKSVPVNDTNDNWEEF